MEKPLKPLEDHYSRHWKKKFPTSCLGCELNEIDFVMTDADIMGCVSTFLANPRRDVFLERYKDYPVDPSDENRPPGIYLLARLGANARAITRHLNGPDGEYFGSLEKLVRLLLACMED